MSSDPSFSMSEVTKRMIEEAASQRLFRHIDVDEPEIAQTHLLRLAEEQVFHALRTAEPATKAQQLRLVQEAWAPFNCRLKDTFLALWAFALCDVPTTVKEHLEALQAAALNNDLTRVIVRDIRTAAKHKSIVKRVLNIGSKTFESLFAEVGLTSIEEARRGNTQSLHDATRAILNAFLTDQTFESDDDNTLVSVFYQNVDALPDPVERNVYFNRFLVQLVSVLKASAKAAPPLKLLNILVQVVDHMLHKEIAVSAQVLDPRVEDYLAKNPIHFFRHSLKHMSSVLPPHSNFKRSGHVLDEWQRQAVRAIRRKENVFISAPPSAGKTAVSTEVIEDNDDVWYITAERAPARQLASILLASLDDQEKRKGVAARNIRLELPGSKPYRRFQRARDNVLVATAEPLWELLHNKDFGKDAKPKYIILDEIHNLTGPQGPYYEYILKYAIYHGIPFMCLGWLPNHDEMTTWLATLLPPGTPLCSINVKKRFFNQRRMVFRTDRAGDVTLAALNPLEHLSLATLRSPTFCHPGLHPTETLRLSESLPSVAAPVDRRVPSLDAVDAFEATLYGHLRTLPDAAVTAIVKERPVDDAPLSLYQIHRILQTMDPVYKPLILFRLESLPCLSFFLRLVQFIRDKNVIVYGNFQDDQPIVQQYLEEAETLCDADDGDDGTGGGSSDAEKHNEMRRKQHEALYATKCLPRLHHFYKTWRIPTPDPVGLAAFNERYGGTLTYEEIVDARAKHVEKQLSYTYKSLRLRHTYEIHDNIKLFTYASGGVMRTIRDQINAELEYQRKQMGPFEDMRDHGAEFDEFNDIVETRHKKRWVGSEQKWVRTDDTQSRRLGRTMKTKEEAGAEYDYTYNISYNHPIMVAAECGIFFYNKLLNPALARVCQLLIGKLARFVVADKELGSSVNYPFAGAWVQGGLKGEPLETPDPGLVCQSFGRAGRRGFDKEAWLFSNGIDTSKVMYPQFHPVAKNDAAALTPLLEGDADAFRTFVLSERRPVPAAAPVVKTVAAATTVAATAVAATAVAATAVAAEAAKNTVTMAAAEAEGPLESWEVDYLAWERAEAEKAMA